MKNLCLSLVLLCSLSSIAQNPKYSAEIEAQIKAVETGLKTWVSSPDLPKRNLQDVMRTNNVHGLSIAVIKDYKMIWTRGYGFADTSDKREVIPQTLFQAASISKSLNALGLMKLAAQQKLDLNKDINTYLSTWKFPYDSVSKGKLITTAHLLSHTAGLTVHGFQGYNWKDSLPGDIEILNGKRPANSPAVRSAFEPGLKFQYSGGGTTISKLIAMDISRLPYDKFMRHEVLAPLGMNSSFYTQPPPPDAFRYLATAYYANGKPIANKFHIYPEQAADGLWTSPTDLCKFLIEVQLSLKGKSNKLLSKELTQLMLTPFIDKSAALGTFVFERKADKYFQHGGANEGFRCQYIGSFENGNGVVIMVNSDNGSIMNEVINSVADVYGWKEFFKQEPKSIIRMPLDSLQKFAGSYAMNGDRFDLKIQNEHLALFEEGSGPLICYFSSPVEMFVTEVPAQATFQFDATGKVNGLKLKQGGREMLYSKLK